MPDHLALLNDVEECKTWLERASKAARAASRTLGRSSDTDRSAALREAASSIRSRQNDILDANEQDVRAFNGPEPLRDRLTLSPARIEAMAASLEEIAGQPDPLHRVLDSWTRPNGLHIERVPSSIGVIGMIYESRPNVGIDAAGLCIKSGNAVILLGGSETRTTAAVLHAAIADGLNQAGLPGEAVQIVPTTDRAMVAAMLAAAGQIDLLIPRGGMSLVERVQREARVPVLSHADGICHTYIHEAADLEKANAVLANAKLRRVSVCGATETLLIDAARASAWLPRIVEEMAAKGCTFRGDERVRSILPIIPGATEDDFHTEWQDAVLSIAVVDGLAGAVAHIALYGSGHTDAILTEDEATARHFLAEVDSAVTIWNASTQFSDGGEFGFGAEIGISTGRIHARGPIGAEQLTTSRYNIMGTGQVRP
ncbi:glutamate-5-semialdehyde dehydrogenase [Ochrobactrum teleogrylli]|uniref:glutamate-5-semialdehyde dehydrogenase n=1 Tax=Ochrobactrum teleogrylli TaxID=2479765 RepID=UPI00384C9B4A